MKMPDLPARIGPVEFGTLGSMVAVRCPREFDPIMRRAGACGSLAAGAGSSSGGELVPSYDIFGARPSEPGRRL